MNDFLTYKGFVCIDNDGGYYLVVNDEFGFKYVPIDDRNGNYDHLTPDLVSVCAVKFYDGTEPVSLDFCNDVKFQDIFIEISDFGDIKSDNGAGIFDIINNDFEETNGLWEVIEEVFKNPTVKANFNDFINRNNHES